MHLQQAQRGRRTSNNPGLRDAVDARSIRKRAADYQNNRHNFGLVPSFFPAYSCLSMNELN